MPGASDGRRAGVAGSRASENAVQDASQGSLFDAFGQVPDAGAAFPGAGDLTPSGSVSGPYAGNSPAGQRDLFAGPGEVSGVGGMVHDPNRVRECGRGGRPGNVRRRPFRAAVPDDRHGAAYLPYRDRTCRTGGARGPAGRLRSVLLRHRDDRIRRVRRPPGRNFGRDRTARGMVYPVQQGEHGPCGRGIASGLCRREDRENRPEHQIRPDGAAQCRHRGVGPALRYDDHPLPARPRVAARHGPSLPHVPRVRSCADRGADR